jgi:hypothetical protein
MPKNWTLLDTVDTQTLGALESTALRKLRQLLIALHPGVHAP